MSRPIAFCATVTVIIILLILPVGTLADEPRRRVVLIQVDAARAGFLDQFLVDGTLPPDGGFATLARSFKATFSTVVTPSLTTPNLATMVTGAYPQKHGMITNVYPPLTGTVTSGIYAHQQPLGVEGIWSAALRAGKNVGLIRTVGVNDNSLSNTWTLNFHEQRAAAKLIKPAASDWSSDLSEWDLGSFANAYSPRVMTFTLQDDYASPNAYAFNVVALDRNSAGTYDALVIDDDHDLSNGYFGVRPPREGTMAQTAPLSMIGDWSSVIFTSTNTTTGLSGTVMGAYLKLYDYSVKPLTIALYATGVWYNPGYPRAWINDLYRTSGPFPRLAPIGGVTNEVDEINFLHREDNFFRDATLNVLRRNDWDLVITYQGLVDNSEHRYLLTDPRQTWYTDPISTTYWERIRESYQAVDALITTISNTVGLTQTDILVASDHGQAPVHTALYINRVLAQAGIQVTAPISAYAQAGGGYAFVYINTTARTGGVIAPEGTIEYSTTQDAIITALENFTDTDRITGETVYPFDHIIRKQDLGAHGLGIATVGDVFASVQPGYSLAGATSAGPLTNSITAGGSHGYAPEWSEMRGIFLGAGPHIGSIESRPTRLIDVAPTIADLLGLDPLAEADGTSLHLMRWKLFLPVVQSEVLPPE